MKIAINDHIIKTEEGTESGLSYELGSKWWSDKSNSVYFIYIHFLDLEILAY